MPAFRVTGGVLRGALVSDNYPGNELPGAEGPVDPGYGIEAGGGHPWVPGHLPPMPPQVWPPLTPTNPIQPAPPGTPPGVIWPPVNRPVDPGYGRPDVGAGHPGGGPMPGNPPRPDNTLPTGGARPDNSLPSQTYWVVVGIPGVGWRYTTIDPSLEIGYPLPPTAEPK